MQVAFQRVTREGGRENEKNRNIVRVLPLGFLLVPHSNMSCFDSFFLYWLYRGRGLLLQQTICFDVTLIIITMFQKNFYIFLWRRNGKRTELAWISWELGLEWKVALSNKNRCCNVRWKFMNNKRNGGNPLFFSKQQSSGKWSVGREIVRDFLVWKCIVCHWYIFPSAVPLLLELFNSQIVVCACVCYLILALNVY